jgi:hypothetical protein
MPLDEDLLKRLENVYQNQQPKESNQPQETTQATSNIPEDVNARLQQVFQEQQKQQYGKALEPFTTTVANWFTGTNKTEFPQMEEIWGNKAGEAIRKEVGWGGFAKLAVGTIINSDVKAQAQMFASSIKGSSILQDKFNNPIFVMPDGQTFYLSKPGASLEDAAQFTSQALQYYGGTAGVTKQFAGNLLMRSLGVAGGAAGVSAAQDIATTPFGVQNEGPLNINTGKALISGALGGATELVAGPAINVVMNKFMRNEKFYTTDLNGTPSLTKKGEEALVAAGIDPKAVGPDEIKTFLNRMSANKDHEAALVASQATGKGFNLTPSQISGNKVGIATLFKAAEESQPYGPEAYIAAKKYIENNNLKIADSSKKLLNNFNKGNVGIEDVVQAGEKIENTVKNNFEKKSLAVETAYNAINKDAMYLGGQSNLDVLNASVKKNIKDTIGLRTDNLHPATTAAMDRIDSFIKELKATSIKKGGKGAIKPADGATLDTFETLRREINGLYKAGLNPQDQLGVLAVKQEFDKFYNDAANNLLFGSGTNLEALKGIKDKLLRARQLSKEEFELYGVNPVIKRGVTLNTDEPGKLIQRILFDPDSNPTNTVNAIFGLGNIGAKKDSVAVVQRLKSIFGVDDMAKASQNADFNALRQAAIEKIHINAMDPKNQTFVPAKLVTQWNNLINKNPLLMDELFTKTEQKYIKEYVMDVQKTLPPADRNLAQPVNLINRLTIGVARMFASKEGMEYGGLFGGTSARNMLAGAIDKFNMSNAKQVIFKEIQEKPGILHNIADPVTPGQLITRYLTGDKGPTVGALASAYQQTGFEKNLRTPIIPVPMAQKGMGNIQPQQPQPQQAQPINTNITNFKSNIFAKGVTAPSANTGSPVNNLLDRIDKSNKLDQFIR